MMDNPKNPNEEISASELIKKHADIVGKDGLLISPDAVDALRRGDISIEDIFKRSLPLWESIE